MLGRAHVRRTSSAEEPALGPALARPRTGRQPIVIVTMSLRLNGKPRNAHDEVVGNSSRPWVSTCAPMNTALIGIGSEADAPNRKEPTPAPPSPIVVQPGTGLQPGTAKFGAKPKPVNGTPVAPPTVTATLPPMFG